MTYQLLAWGGVKDLAVNAEIPDDPRNAQWLAYQAWLAAGNVPAAVAPPDTMTALAQKIVAGCQIVSTANPALNGIYPLDDASLLKIAGVATRLALGKGLPLGGTTVGVPDIAGVPHAFSAADIENLGDALSDYVAGLQAVAITLLDGGQAPWPPSVATIA